MTRCLKAGILLQFLVHISVYFVNPSLSRVAVNSKRGIIKGDNIITETLMNTHCHLELTRSYSINRRKHSLRINYLIRFLSTFVINVILYTLFTMFYNLKQLQRLVHKYCG